MTLRTVDGRIQWSQESWVGKGPPTTLAEWTWRELREDEQDLYQPIGGNLYALRPPPSKPPVEGENRLKAIRRRVHEQEKAERNDPPGPDVRSESYLLSLDSHARFNQIRQNDYEDFEVEKQANVKSGKWPASFLSKTKKAVENVLRNQRLRGEA